MSEILAGPFSAGCEMRAALAGTSGMNVACGSCRGCCTSSYFIRKVRAHEHAALEGIGQDKLRPVPGRHEWRAAHGLHGRTAIASCFANGNCAYLDAHRPETCRTYDCRAHRGVHERRT